VGKALLNNNNVSQSVVTQNEKEKKTDWTELFHVQPCSTCPGVRTKSQPDVSEYPSIGTLAENSMLAV